MKRIERSWMYERLDAKKKFNPVFVNGVEEFIKHVKQLDSFRSNNGKLRCPCSKCRNTKFLNEYDVRLHLTKHGFCLNYYDWVCHGEDFPISNIVMQKRNVEDVSFSNTASDTAKRNFNEYFIERALHGERGIDFKHVSKNVESIIHHHDWGELVQVRSNDLNLTMVKEFYAVLSEASSLESVQSVNLRTTTVPFTPKAINEYFKIPEIPIETLYSRVWDLDNDKALTAKAFEAKNFLAPKATWMKGKRFMFGSASKDVRVIKHLVNFNLLSSSKTNTFTYEEACLTMAIMKKVPVDVGRIIFRKAVEFARGMKKDAKLPFPYLTSDLCLRAQVKSFDSDTISEPNETVIGPNIQELKETTPHDGPSSSQTVPPSDESIIESSTPSSDSSRFKVLEAKIHKLESSVDVLKRGLVNLNDNVVKGFDHINDTLDNLREGIRGHREYHAQNPNSRSDDGFVNCQEEPFVGPQWIPVLPPTPTPSVPGGTSNVSTTGTTLEQTDDKETAHVGGSPSNAPPIGASSGKNGPHDTLQISRYKVPL